MDTLPENFEALLETIRDTHPDLYQATLALQDRERHWHQRAEWREEASLAVPPDHLRAEQERSYVMESARCLLWYAIIHNTGHPYYLHWEMTFPEREATQRFFPLHIEEGESYGDAFYRARFTEDRYDIRIAESIRAGKSYEHMFRAISASGSVHWMQEAVRVETQEPGQKWRAAGVCIDITERKLAEDALRESEQRFRTLVNDLPILVWMLDADNRTEMVNRAWAEFMGCPEEEARDFDWRTVLHPDDQAHMNIAFGEAYEARKPYQSVYRMRRKDGQYRWLYSSAAPRVFPDNTFVGYIGSSLDITEQKALQEQLREAQKLESLGRLAGGVAHDFNNLLTAIMGYTELALATLPEAAEETPLLENVLAASERAANLTRQLLTYARRQMVEFTAIDINKVILGMDPLLRRTIGEQYELVTLLAEDVCCVQSNVSQIEQVLLNLVLNARDALQTRLDSHDHGTDLSQTVGRILIETHVVLLDEDYAAQHIGATAGEYVMFAVSDNGIGMTPEIRERIFEPFFTTKGAGKGTGLGLATSYGIVKQSKGNIWVYSEPNVGTTFKVYIPRVQTPAHITSAPLLPSRNLPVGSETILLVDDEPMVRDAAARILREHGYEVLEAGTGSEALHIATLWQNPIHLLLTDVVMPLMGGKELAERLHSFRPEIRVLFMSGYTQNTILQSGILNPGIQLLTKPFSASSLVRKVGEELGK